MQEVTPDEPVRTDMLIRFNGQYFTKRKPNEVILHILNRLWLILCFLCHPKKEQKIITKKKEIGIKNKSNSHQRCFCKLELFMFQSLNPHTDLTKSWSTSVSNICSYFIRFKEKETKTILWNHVLLSFHFKSILNFHGAYGGKVGQRGCKIITICHWKLEIIPQKCPQFKPEDLF